MTTCPKCGHVRQPGEKAPAWQCPACHIAYAKYRPPAPIETLPADAPPLPGGMVEEAVEAAMEEVRNLEDHAHRGPLATAVNFTILAGGAALILYATGPLQFAAKRELHPMLALLGLVIAAAGIAGIALAQRMSEQVLRAVYTAYTVLVFLLLNWLALEWAVDWLRGVSLFRVNGQVLAGVAIAALDVFVLAYILRSIAAQGTGRRPTASGNAAWAVASIALASWLYSSGALDAIYRKVGLTPPGPAAAVGWLYVPRRERNAPELPLEAYAGRWYGQFRGRFGFGESWVSRLEVEVARDKARVRLWRACPQGACDAGVFDAVVESRSRGKAQALHVAGTTGGMDWLVTIYPAQGQLRFDERHIRGRDWGTNSSVHDSLTRDPPPPPPVFDKPLKPRPR